MARDGYTWQPNKGDSIRVNAEGTLEDAHTANFVDAILTNKPVSAKLAAGVEACRPVQMALRSYWTGKRVAGSEIAINES